MNNWTHEHDIRVETQRLISSHTLKRCPLCGAVNALTNDECFICRWHGEFDTRPAEIEQGVHQLFDRCPELAMAMIDRSTQDRKRRPWISRLVTRFAQLLRTHK